MLMDELIQQVLSEVMRLADPNSEYDYEEYEQLTELRQNLVDAIESKSQPLNDQQKQQVLKILSYDDPIMSRMGALLKEAERELRSVHVAKKQQVAYNYNGMSEGFMFDKKK